VNCAAAHRFVLGVALVHQGETRHRKGPTRSAVGGNWTATLKVFAYKFLAGGAVR